MGSNSARNTLLLIFSIAIISKKEKKEKKKKKKKKKNGPIPQDISNLHNLEYLGMEYNNLSRVRPSRLTQEIGNIYELEQLAFVSNSLNGTILSGIFNMSKLKVISLDRNDLSGNFPTTYNLPNLEELYLGNNNLKGDASSSGEWSFLTSLMNCPYSQELLQDYKSFKRYFLVPTSLRDHFPIPFVHFQNVSSLGLSSNQISGAILECISNVIYLRELYLSSNKSLSLKIRKLHAVVVIDLSGNLFLGSIPRSIGDLENLTGISGE
ncbi:Non-specific serine/threonine protein kinase [Handroanthus impetiginosus]|uniref:Non-specific serine/threonine protein kinase n=1 Tax=Handroanthus impetiginosus TaxID=429701 RepID=A0A2G9I6P3_9LAMI|nr:Non-specific serine/threonine protein kinase [Handroanthus impetiginosus]